MIREDIDYVTEKTIYSVCFLSSLGYTLIPKKKGKTIMEDQFEVRHHKKHVPHWNKKKKEWVRNVQRKFFFEFASSRHKTLQTAEADRRIDGYID